MKQVFTFKLDEPDPLAVFSCLHDMPYSLFFDSADQTHPLSRHSLIAFHPFETIEVVKGRTIVTNTDQQLSLEGDPFKILRQRLKSWSRDLEIPKRELPPFIGGAAGFFGYDLARALEALPEKAAANETIPDMAIGLYDQVIAFDHFTGKNLFIAIAADENTAHKKYARLLSLITEKIETSRSISQDIQLSWSSSFSADTYKNAVQRVIDYIYAGDIFQANISQRFKAPLPAGFDSFAHYRALRRVNAAPFAAYMNFGTFKIASASPERFLSAAARQVETRPIKGTRRRTADPIQDAKNRADLAASAKDRAENAMIVDLMRNDLSKVCEDFSLHVEQLCGIESFAAVHHLVSIIRGTLRADRKPIDLLRACFPGGSITGAPKVRAMEIIEEIEPQRRGPYCGSLGYIGFNDTMDTNIAIRTLIYEHDKVWFNVGGGIVSDSIPADEYQETLDKASAIFGSFYTAEKQEKRA